MKARRFQLPDPAPRDSEIIERSTGLKINLYRQSCGKIHGEVIIKCGVGMFAADDDDDDYDVEAAEQRQADAMEFARRLLGEFQKQRPEERGLSC